MKDVVEVEGAKLKRRYMPGYVLEDQGPERLHLICGATASPSATVESQRCQQRVERRQVPTP